MSVESPRPHTLHNLQGLRALAAFLVLYHHYIRYPQIGLSDWYGAVGVDIFFVISGFVITYAKRGSASDFIVRRIIRIAPLYWILTLLWVSLALILKIGGSGLTPESLTWQLTLKSLFFIPDQPIITRGWTLNYEMYFYVLFSIGMMISKEYYVAICGILIILIFSIVNLANIGRPLNFYGSAHVFEFLAGSASFYVWQAIGRRQAIIDLLSKARHALPILAIALLAGCCWSSDVFRDRSLIAVTACSGLFVLTVVSMEKYCGIYIHNRLITLLGDASYSTYLVHRFIYAPMARSIFPHLANQPTWLKLSAFVPIAVIVIAGSVLVHLVVERPVTRALSNAWRRWSGATESQTNVAQAEWGDDSTAAVRPTPSDSSADFKRQ